MAWWQNPWLPWNYPKDLSNSFMQQLENGLLYLFAHILDAILTLISSILGQSEYEIQCCNQDRRTNDEHWEPQGTQCNR